MPDRVAMETSPRIFISYSRADGREFAEAFERRLENDAGIRSWRDLKNMGSGDIRPQVLRAIEETQHLVLILSRRALASDWVKREWTHAREWGRMVSPVLADPTLKRADLPGWMRRSEVFDIADPERWQMLKQVLLGNGETRRVPYMAGDLAEDFVPRPTECARLKQAVLAAGSDRTVAVTTALRGAGGYGKTTLANYLCRDPDVRFEFTDGILRVEIGKERDDVTGLIIDLIETLEPQGKRPGFQDVQTAAEYLAKLIGEARLLLVIDDVWREAQLRPFLRGGPNCARLVTTRLPQVLPAGHTAIVIDAMRDAEALSLIAAGLPHDATTRGRLAALADRLGNWAQMLGIANGWLRERVAQGEALGGAIARFERRLATRGLTGFDPKDEQQRNRAIRACVEASLEDLAPDELVRFGELAALPEDEAVPLDVVAALWREAGGLDADDADDLVGRLHGRSLLQSLDRSTGIMRLHDNMVWYLRDRIGAEGCRAVHAAMVRALHARCDGGWETLPPEETYGWRFLIRHQRGAGQDAEADQLLSNYAWIKAKLRAVGARELFEGYLPERSIVGPLLLGRAIALSLPALSAYPRELPRQLYGRLCNSVHRVAADVVAAARLDPDFRPAPRWPGLTPPGTERLRLVGHQLAVNSACFCPDGNRVATASNDRTVRLWNATTGQEIIAIYGHENWVRSVDFSPDGTRVVTAAWDSTARLWDLATRQELASLRGHEGWVHSASFSPDGTLVVTGGKDRTVRLWDATRAQELIVLRGHEESVNSAGFSPDSSRIVTASSDGTARVWDVATGQELATLSVGGDGVWSACYSADGTRVVTAAKDGTAQLWDASSGQMVALLCGQEGGVRSACFSPDGGRIVAACWNGTVRLCNAYSGKQFGELRGHEGGVSSACFSPDGAQILTASEDGTARLWDTAGAHVRDHLPGHDGTVSGVRFSWDGACVLTASADGTARMWDAATGRELAVLRGHEDGVRDACFSPDGARIATAALDGTARLWDAATGRELIVLRRHGAGLRSVSFAPEGARIVTAAWDGTARVWDAATGEELAMLKAPETNIVQRACFSPDGTCIVAALGDGTARLWDAFSRLELAALRGHKGAVGSVGFSADGRRIVTASDDGTARLWDALIGRDFTVLRGHEGAVNNACFAAGGARVVTASDDRTARIWDVATGEEVARIALDATINGLSVHGGAIALGDGLGRIHVFNADEFLRADSPVGG
jgi:WD40 repeat protein